MLGRALKMARRKLGLTQESLAETLGVNTVSISRWENDHMVPEPEHQRELVRVLGVSPSLFKRSATSAVTLGHMIGLAPDAETAVFNDVQTLLWSFSRLPADEREEVIEFAQRLRLRVKDREEADEEPAQPPAPAPPDESA